MTITVTSQIGDHTAHQTVVSDKAKKAVRIGFNPSALPRVDRLKALAAAFITECENGQSEMPYAGREYAVAITEMQKASMFAVLAATTDVA
jgi:hypothetical protein